MFAVPDQFAIAEYFLNAMQGHTVFFTFRIMEMKEIIIASFKIDFFHGLSNNILLKPIVKAQDKIRSSKILVPMNAVQ